MATFFIKFITFFIHFITFVLGFPAKQLQFCTTNSRENLYKKYY